MWKCCLPWCGQPEGKALPPSSSPPISAPESPPRARQPSPLLQDIEEESENQAEEGCFEDEPTTLQPLSTRISYKKRRNVQSPSPTLSAKAVRKTGQRTRSVTSTTSSEGSSSGVKMQAEQGSIGDLQKYHNRYLRNRRHTLANVR